MQYYSAMRMKELLLHATIDESHRHNNENNPDIKNICCMITCIWSSKQAKLIYSDRIQNGDYFWWRGCLFPGMEHVGIICGEGNVIYIDLGEGYNAVSYANIHWMVYLWFAHFAIYTIYLN